jgi:predicted SnoaL-like aldol condensation-catalyzing enzyme
MSIEDNKRMAVTFLKQVAVGDIEAAYDAFIAPGFVHHNAYFAGDRASLKAGMQAAAMARPEKTIEVKRAIGEGDMVVTHSHVRQFPADAGAAVVHLFRFERGWIVELWDVGQPVPEQQVNAHGVF